MRTMTQLACASILLFLFAGVYAQAPDDRISNISDLSRQIDELLLGTQCNRMGDAFLQRGFQQHRSRAAGQRLAQDE